MEETIRQRQNNIVNDNIEKNLTINLDSLSDRSNTLFEDLSNEILYEIFDFLDFCQVYEAFSDLNKRFTNLLNDPTLPIKINLPSVSRSTFQRYYSQIIIPNQHRTRSLRLSNPFIIDLVFLPVSIIFKFTRLENLVFHQVKSECLKNILICLRCLPYLSSLVIDCIDEVRNKDRIYREVLRLPVLKYCKLSLPGHTGSISLPIATTDFSLIEHLVITNNLQLDEVNSLLSYVPQLLRLSLYLSGLRWTYLEPYTTQLNRLTHISFDIECEPFNQLRLYTKNLFHHVEVLHISAKNDIAYLDESQWELFILSDMPNLRVFDVMISCSFPLCKNPDECLPIIARFNSSFWFKRQWFFEYQVCTGSDPFDGVYLSFYSVNPYRRRYFKFIHEIPRKTSPSSLQRNINSVHSIQTHNYPAMINCEYYFPNATKLSIVGTSDNDNNNSLVIGLNNIISLQQITKLVLHLNSSCFSQFVELLSFTPNIHTFQISLLLGVNVDLASIQNSESFRSLSRTNNIKEMSLFNCTLQMKKCFINLGRRLEHLTIDYSKDTSISFLRSLLSKDNEIRHLFSLNMEISEREYKQLETFVVSEKLFDIRLIKTSCGLFRYEIRFWW